MSTVRQPANTACQVLDWAWGLEEGESLFAAKSQEGRRWWCLMLGWPLPGLGATRETCTEEAIQAHDGTSSVPASHDLLWSTFLGPSTEPQESQGLILGLWVPTVHTLPRLLATLDQTSYSVSPNAWHKELRILLLNERLEDYSILIEDHIP